MAELREVAVPPRSTERLSRILGPARSTMLRQAAGSARHAIGRHRLWNVNSTAAGGGVAEMLQLLVGYARDLEVDARWVVIEGSADFFATTKRLHNRLHGMPGDSGELGARESQHYRSVLETNARALCQEVQRGDVVILHDPQTAGLADHLVSRGARVVWRCHIGTDRQNSYTRQAWDFLLPYLTECRTYVFSHAAFVPPELGTADVWIIAPSIDPLSPKNRPMPRDRVVKILAGIGLLPGEPDAPQTAVLGGAGPFNPEDRVLLQVSRWDGLKDMRGVLRGFSEHVARRGDTRLALVGPSVDGVADDPEAARVLAECVEEWESLPHSVRRCIRLVVLPMDDAVRNGLMVNAAQRHATLVVQKSLQEGFGLTITEAMWKSRPVVASAVGGIVDQVPPGAGVLLENPTDLDVFGQTLNSLLDQPEQLPKMGRRGRRHVREQFLSDRHLIDFARLVSHVCSSS